MAMIYLTHSPSGACVEALESCAAGNFEDLTFDIVIKKNKRHRYYFGSLRPASRYYLSLHIFLLLRHHIFLLEFMFVYIFAFVFTSLGQYRCLAFWSCWCLWLMPSSSWTVLKLYEIFLFMLKFEVEKLLVIQPNIHNRLYIKDGHGIWVWKVKCLKPALFQMASRQWLWLYRSRLEYSASAPSIHDFIINIL